MKHLHLFEEYKLWSKEDRIRQIKLDETIRVYEDDDILVVIPKTIHSACLYGKGTNWCYASEDEKKMVDDGRMKSMGWNSTFDDYNERDVIYIFIMKKENEKYTLMFEDGRFMDSSNEEHDFAEFIKKFPKLKKVLESNIKNGTYRKYPYPFIHLDYMNTGNKPQFLTNPFEFDVDRLNV